MISVIGINREDKHWAVKVKSFFRDTINLCNTNTLITFVIYSNAKEAYCYFENNINKADSTQVFIGIELPGSYKAFEITLPFDIIQKISTGDIANQIITTISVLLNLGNTFKHSSHCVDMADIINVLKDKSVSKMYFKTPLRVEDINTLSRVLEREKQISPSSVKYIGLYYTVLQGGYFSTKELSDVCNTIIKQFGKNTELIINGVGLTDEQSYKQDGVKFDVVVVI